MINVSYDTLGPSVQDWLFGSRRFEEGIETVSWNDSRSENVPQGRFWGMWKSVVPNLILVSNPTIHFFVYERVRIIMSRIAKRRGSALTSLEFFLMGAIAKTVATFLTYPLQVVQSQLRNDAKSAKGKQKYKGTFDCCEDLSSGWICGLVPRSFRKVVFR